jgi:hypothetical protein
MGRFLINVEEPVVAVATGGEEDLSSDRPPLSSRPKGDLPLRSATTEEIVSPRSTRFHLR